MTTFDRSQITGWGADLDRSKRPAVPMERQPPRLDGVHWDIPAAQPQTVEVLHSIERPGLTPVFGTAVPPRGASGMLRRAAFTYAENDLRHWMMLMLADRVDVAEHTAMDTMRSPKTRTVVALGALGLAGYLLYRRSRDRTVVTIDQSKAPVPVDDEALVVTTTEAEIRGVELREA